MLLAAALASRSWPPIALAVVVLGALYVLPDGDRALPAPLYAAALLVMAELAFWSIETGLRLRAEPGADAPRLAAALAVAAGSVPIGALALAAGGADADRSVALTAAGAAAVVACGAVFVVLSRRASG